MSLFREVGVSLFDKTTVLNTLVSNTRLILRASMKTCVKDAEPESSLRVGDRYIELLTSNNVFFYIPVKDLLLTSSNTNYITRYFSLAETSQLNIETGSRGYIYLLNKLCA